MRAGLPNPLVPAPHEAPLDYVSRLSFRNGRDGARALCADFGIRPRAVEKGDADALSTVALLGGTTVAALLTNVFRPTGERGRILHRGQTIHGAIISRHHVRLCPTCVELDIEKGRGRFEARPWRRSEWLLRDIRTCTGHGMALVDLGVQRDAAVPDFSRAVSGVVADIADMRAGAKRQTASGLERYILRRLQVSAPEASSAVEILDGLPLYACIRFAEVLGAVALDGPDASMTGVTEGVLHERQAAGFEIAAGGRSSVKDFLDRLRHSRGRRTGSVGPQALFGRLYLWLTNRPRDPAYDPLRDIVRDQCLATIALRPGGPVVPFGGPVTVRLLHSVRSASIEYGINPVSLRKAVPVVGVLAAERTDLTDDMVTFDANEHASFLRDLASSLEFHEAGARLGMSATVLEACVANGVVEPWLGSRQGFWKRRFRTGDLERFLSSLSRGIDPTLVDDSALLPVALAAKSVGVRQSEVIRLLAEGSLRRVAVADGAEGLAALRVDPAEISDRIRPSAGDRRTMSQVSQETQLAPHVLRALVRAGALPPFRRSAARPTDRTVSIHVEEARRFRKEFAALAELATLAGTTPRLLWNRLTEAGAVPAFDHRAIGAVVYRRSTLPDISQLNLEPWPAGKRRPR